MDKQALVILSGGPDSAAAALWAKNAGYKLRAITFQFRSDEQYGELLASMLVAQALRIPHRIIDFTGPVDAFSPNMHIMMHAGVPAMTADRSKPYMMPFGSGTLLAYASSYAIHEGMATVFWGGTADDAAAHDDYSQQFGDELSALIRRVTKKELRIVAPFGAKHKPEVVSTFSAKPDLFSLTWSCRHGGTVQCGICEGCTARRVAADLASIVDATTYIAAEYISPFPHLKEKPLSDFTNKDWSEVEGITPMGCIGGS